MKLTSLMIVGGGQMARALVAGMIRGGVVAAEHVCVIEPHAASRQWWQSNQPDCRITADLAASLEPGVPVILAVKPPVVATVLRTPGVNWDGHLVISIAAGISLEQLTADAGHDRVVRVMPNTPALIGQGISGFCVGKGVSPDDSQTVRTLLESFGGAVEVNPTHMDAVTGLSGSGPAYVFLFIEALADGGVLAGLPRDVAMKLATQTVLGAAMMVDQTGLHPGQLKDNVCSPGGTTIAAINVLEHNGFRGAVIQAVAAASRRSAELSQ